MNFSIIILTTMTIILFGLVSPTNSITNVFEGFTYETVIPQRILLSPKRSSDRITSYRINGFNQTFNLSLFQDDSFLSPGFIIQYFTENQTWINRNIRHCFYKGYVNNNRSSVVSISLCDGLFGTFIYNNTEYFLEPKSNEKNSSWNFEHVFYTHDDLVSSSTEATGSCPVQGKPYFEEKNFVLSPSMKMDSSNVRKNRQYNFDQTAKHVEVLIAYDDSIKEFHPDIDIQSYILTLFSYVSHLYSDASIGNNIKLWLVKLVELGKDLSNQIRSIDDAADILASFCAWQRDYNIPGTYDTAVLLTRIPLCNKRAKNITNSKCDTLGITELGTMCNLTSNCAVVRDNGFATAFTIAHEIAHLFGIRHDNDKVCLDFNHEQNIMATSLLFNFNHYKWSNCSRHYFTQYFESNRYPCLNNIPNYKSSVFEGLNNEQKARELPGHFNDLDDQCRRAFGIQFEYCKDLSHGPKCIRLYCREKIAHLSSCITNHAHWSDGTLCSEPRTDIKRCFHGQCRSSQDVQAINGHWSEWSSWSSCTRTCGSAVQKSQRLCDNPKPENGGQYCSGQATRMRSCEDNPPCQESTDMFRRRQCSLYNNRTIDPSLPMGVRYEPKYNVLPTERCKLICKVIDDRLERSFIFSNRVEDGTPCGHEDETRDICISGICMPIGCDLKYGSNATEDACGICNGQNRTCQLINGQKTVSNFGITSVVNIPMNATRISITQISSMIDRYYLAVKHPNGTYILNGLHSLQLYNIQIRMDSAIIFYSGFDSSNESILITGHIKAPLEIQVISIHQSDPLPTEIYWEYYISLGTNEFIEPNEYKSLDSYCDRPCQGFKEVKKCIIYEKEYDSVYCTIFKLSLEDKTERCNDDCALNWTARYQQTCSTRCGDGYKRVVYDCAKSSSSTEWIDEDICRKYVGEKPDDIVPCIGDCTEIGWIYGGWSECHYKGDCVRERLVECRNSSDLTISAQYCNSEFIFNIEQCADTECEQLKLNFTTQSNCDCTKIHRRQQDNLCSQNGEPTNDPDCLSESKSDETLSCINECLKPHWQTNPWEPCTVTCSSHKGIRQRRVDCIHQNSIVQDAYCNQQLKPIEREWCSSNNSCLIWFTSEWSTCSVTCGPGVQERQVYCIDPERLLLRLSDGECQHLLGENSKPNEQQDCSMVECPYWQTNSWSDCSGKCGLAKRDRYVWCLHNGLEVDDNYCLQMYHEKPPTIEICDREWYCPKWTVGIWSECSVSCGDGMQNRLVSCRNQETIVNAIECDDADRPETIKQCHMSLCQEEAPLWMTSDWTRCDLQTCMQTRTIHCLDSVNQRNLSIYKCIQNQIQPVLNRVCPIADCLEWHVGQWHGCLVKCGFGTEYGSDLHCYTRQIPITRLNNSICESVEPQLPKPELKRICRRNCIEWRIGHWAESLLHNSSSKGSLSLLIILVHLVITLKITNKT